MKATSLVQKFGLLCLVLAALLLLLVSVSVPLWNSVYFVKGVNSRVPTVTLGNWGYCSGDHCPTAFLGYTVYTTLKNGDLGPSVVITGLTYVLVLHPIIAGLIIIGVLFGLGSSPALGLVSLVFSLLAFVVTVVVFALDLVLFVTAHHRLSNANYTTSYGSAFWMVLASIVLQLVACFTTCFARNSARKEREGGNSGSQGGGGVGGWIARRGAKNPFGDDMAMGDRKHFWQKK
ncbi:hypothetical protein RQP46_000478 [Phenoliferia psychrophenolica]